MHHIINTSFIVKLNLGIFLFISEINVAKSIENVRQTQLMPLLDSFNTTTTRVRNDSIEISSLKRLHVMECREMTYDQRLRYSLKGRRERGDLIQAFKIFNGYDDLEPNEIFSQSTYLKTRNQLRVRHCKTDIRKFSFSYRVVEIWNNLPKQIKEAPSVNAFKNRMDADSKLRERFYEYDERGNH